MMSLFTTQTQKKNKFITEQLILCQDKEFLYYYYKHLNVRQKWITTAYF